MQIKLVLNTFHIMINSSKYNIYNRYIRPIGILIASPFIIIISIIIDFLTLPSIIWKSDEYFEEKY